MPEKFVESGSIVRVPCPNPECDEEYNVNIIGQVKETLSESCNGCNKKIWAFENGIHPHAKFFNIKSGDGGSNNHKQRYKRIDLEEGIWKPLY